MINKILTIVSGASCLAVLLSAMLFSPEAKALHSLSQTATAELSSLNDLRWQYRLILVNSESQAKTDEMISELDFKRLELVDRKLIVFILQPNKVRLWTGGQLVATLQDSIMQDIKARLVDYNTVLIGLDGGGKASYAGLLLNEIFRDIDGMPMRRRER